MFEHSVATLTAAERRARPLHAPPATSPPPPVLLLVLDSSSLRSPRPLPFRYASMCAPVTKKKALQVKGKSAPVILPR